MEINAELSTTSVKSLKMKANTIEDKIIKESDFILPIYYELFVYFVY